MPAKPFKRSTFGNAAQKPRFTAVMVCVTFLVMASGCSIFKKTSTEYLTVQPSPNRDTDKAIASNKRGLKMLDCGKMGKAEKAFQESLAADVTFAPAHNNLGWLYLSQRKLYLAAWEFDYAAKLLPNRPEPLNNLGMVHEKAEQFDCAVEVYAKAHDLRPNNPLYLGNLIRAGLRKGDSVATVTPLLKELIAIDNRPEWVAWAKELVNVSSEKCDSETEIPIEPIPFPAPEGSAEIIPTPKVEMQLIEAQQ